MQMTKVLCYFSYVLCDKVLISKDLSYTVNDRLSARGSIKHPFWITPQSRGKNCYNHQVQISTQVTKSDQLKLGANLNKRKWKIFVINSKRNFGKNFVKNLLACLFLLFSFFKIFLISPQVQLSTQPEKTCTQLLLLTMCPGHPSFTVYVN